MPTRVGLFSRPAALSRAAHVARGGKPLLRFRQNPPMPANDVYPLWRVLDHDEWTEGFVTAR